VKRLRNMLGLVLASLSIMAVMLFSSGSAQLAIKLVGPDGSVMDITGHNQPRGDDALILYDSAFGKSTRTNQYGVEVIAVPSTQKVPDGKAYQVTGITSVWECSKTTQLESAEAACGNAAIPPNGIVISAMGTKRDWLKTWKPGDTLIVQEEWFKQQQAKISVINPTPANNPAGSGFPGFRASNQIVVYNPAYGRPNTGTNEFGFEVTVRNGIVVAQEGSDSTIPPDGYVLSGHGKGRSWLIANTPLGAKVEISPDGQMVTSTVDFDTYVYQFDQQWVQSPCANAAWNLKPTTDKACDAIREKRQKAVGLSKDGRSGEAAALIQDALEGMNRRIWQSYSAFPSDTVRGAWHRPVEKTPVAIGQTLDRLKAAGINAVFLETFFHGYTIFPSKTFQEYGLPVQNPKFAGVDLLQLWVEEAHKRNMKVHTWFQAFYAGTKAYMPPGPILAKYPGWANVQYSALVPVMPANPADAARNGANHVSKFNNVYKAPGTLTSQKPNGTAPKGIGNGNGVVNGQIPSEPKKAPDKPVASTLELGGYFLDPANPQVQTFLLKLADEIATRYDIDGFQLDYIRYPSSFPSDRFSYRKTTWGYTDVARRAFKGQYGVDPVDIDPKDPDFDALWMAWNQYKTAQINNFVQKVTHSIRQKRPGLKISAAVFPEAESALALKHQDWRAWALNGWIDFYAPMTLTSAIKVVERDTRYMINATRGRIPVYSGIFGPFNDNTAEHVLSQIDTAKQAGAQGYVLFDTAHLTTRMLEALKVVQAPQQAVAPPPVPSVQPKENGPAPASKPKKKRWWHRK
jgi:uncharacterized lipoprotein YddW (UPF0748 family)